MDAATAAAADAAAERLATDTAAELANAAWLYRQTMGEEQAHLAAQADRERRRLAAQADRERERLKQQFETLLEARRGCLATVTLNIALRPRVVRGAAAASLRCARQARRQHLLPAGLPTAHP